MRQYLSNISNWLEFRAKRLLFFTVPPTGRRVFYPGCALVSADPDLTISVYKWLCEHDPDIGLWFDCCGMPLAQFVSDKAAEKFQQDLAAYIRQKNISAVIVACGNCAAQFKKLQEQLPDLKVTSLYDLLAKEQWPQIDEAYVLHHPCPARTDKTWREGAERLLDATSLFIENRERKGHPLTCCLVKTDRALQRRERLADKHLLTYCAHCVREFQAHINTVHILQLLFNRQDNCPVPMAKQWKGAVFAAYRRFKKMTTGCGDDCRGGRLAARYKGGKGR